MRFHVSKRQSGRYAARVRAAGAIRVRQAQLVLELAPLLLREARAAFARLARGRANPARVGSDRRRALHHLGARSRWSHHVSPPSPSVQLTSMSRAALVHAHNTENCTMDRRPRAPPACAPPRGLAARHQARAPARATDRNGLLQLHVRGERLAASVKPAAAVWEVQDAHVAGQVTTSHANTCMSKRVLALEHGQTLVQPHELRRST